MKTFLVAVVSAALFSAVATQIHALGSGNIVLLLALCFCAALGTAAVAVRFAARQDAPDEDEAGARSPAKRGRQAGDGRKADHGKREVGTVKWFDRSKGYGFIIRQDADEIFVHPRSIRRRGNERQTLDDGQTVSFVAVERQRGWQAEDVVGQ